MPMTNFLRNIGHVSMCLIFFGALFSLSVWMENPDMNLYWSGLLVGYIFLINDFVHPLPRHLFRVLAAFFILYSLIPCVERYLTYPKYYPSFNFSQILSVDDVFFHVNGKTIHTLKLENTTGQFAPLYDQNFI